MRTIERHQQHRDQTLRPNSKTPADLDTIIGGTAPYGIDDFGQAALRGGLHFDSRQRPDSGAVLNITEGIGESGASEQITGINLQASGFYAPQAWDVASQYGGADGVVAAYVGNRRAHLALRVGGRKGETPPGSRQPTSAASTTAAT